MNEMNPMQHLNCLYSNFAVALVARTTGEAWQLLPPGRHGSDTDCDQLNKKAGPPGSWMCNEMNLRALMSIGLLNRELTKSATTNNRPSNTYYEGIKHRRNDLAARRSARLQ